MRELYGVVLLDHIKVILRIYQADNKEWKLLHYQDRDLAPENYGKTPRAADIAESIADLLSSPHSQHVAEWKACCRNLSTVLLAEIVSATGLQIENLSKLREQELICKGMFTELW